MKKKAIKKGKTDFLGILFLVGAAVFYGISPFSIDYLAEEGMDTMSFITFRTWIGLPAVFFMLRALIPNRRIVPPVKEIPIIFILSVLAAGFTPLLLYGSCRYVAPGAAETMHYIYPALVIFGCFLFQGAKLRRKDVFCAFLGFVGVILFYIPAFKGSVSVFGLSLALASGFAYSAFIIISGSERIKKIPELQLVFYMFLVTFVLFSLYELISGNMKFPTSPKGIMMLALSVIITISAIVLFQLGLGRAGPQPASLLSLLEPLTTVIAGAVFFKDKLTLLTAAGSIVVFISVLLSVIPDKAEKGENK